MAVIYSDNEIAMLIAEPKPLPSNWRSLLQTKPKWGHDESEFLVTIAAQNEFRVIIRKSRFNSIDFSAILGVRLPQSNRIFRLRRYNGKSHEHTNKLEGQTFYDFHIHTATERYQKLGNRDPREDAFAEVTDRYGDATGALDCLITDAGFETEGP